MDRCEALRGLNEVYGRMRRRGCCAAFRTAPNSRFQMGSLVLPSGLPQIDYLHGTAEDGLIQPPESSLSTRERLLFQQLAQSNFWRQRNGGSLRGRMTRGGAPDKGENDAIPERLELTRGLVLHDWQNQCVEAWFRNEKRGVIKVVTGAGKTVLALAIAERLQQSEVPALRIAIVVPTVVLLSQWQEELAIHGNLPATAIGLMGAGHNDRFSGDTCVLICVLNSAARKLAQTVEDAGIADRLLLIVDECHRAVPPKCSMSSVRDAHFPWAFRRPRSGARTCRRTTKLRTGWTATRSRRPSRIAFWGRNWARLSLKCPMPTLSPAVYCLPSRSFTMDSLLVPKNAGGTIISASKSRICAKVWKREIVEVLL